MPHSNVWLFPLETQRPWMNDTTSTKQIVYKSKIIFVNCVYNNVNSLGYCVHFQIIGNKCACCVWGFQHCSSYNNNCCIV